MSRSNSAPRILVVDNHDSFVFTLVAYLHELGAQTILVESEDLGDPRAALADVDAVMISPGPGAPADVAPSVALVHAAVAADVPLLGVCLGHQVIAAAFGADVVRAEEPVHGRASALRHSGTGMFAGIEQGVLVGRYHSLVVDPATLPDELVVSADADGVVMAIAHRTAAVQGVQFHPESVLTERGHDMLAAWLASVTASEPRSTSA